MNLAKETSKGLFWSALEGLGSQGIQFAVQIILARLIAPSEFGLLAILTVFIMFCQVITDGGFSQAIIQRVKVSRDDVNTAFSCNIVASLLLYTALFLGAPWIAEFFSEPRLNSLLRLLGLALIIDSGSKCHIALLNRQLQFRRILGVSMPAIFVGGVVGIGCALGEMGAMALIIHRLVTSLLTTLGFWLFGKTDPAPTLGFHRQSFTEMAKFGAGMMGSAILTQGSQQAISLVVGKVYPLNQLAFFQRARTFYQTPLQLVTGIINRVFFPVLSTIQDDDERLLQVLKRGTPFVIFASAPAMLFIIVAAEPIIVFLLTEKWLGAVPYLRCFPLLGILYPVAAIQLTVIRSKGHGGLHFTIVLCKTIMIVTALLVTLRSGLLAIAIGQVVAGIAGQLLDIQIANRMVGYRLPNLLMDLFPAIALAVVVSVLTMLLPIQNLPSFLVLLIQGLVFAASYLALALLIQLPAAKPAVAGFTSTVARAWKR